MAIRRRKMMREMKSHEAPPAGEAMPLATPPLSADTTSATDAPAQPAIELPVQTEQTLPAQGRKLSFLQIALIAVVVFSAAFLTYSLIWSPSASKTQTQATAAQLPPSVADINDTPAIVKEIKLPVVAADEKTEPVSLQIAENYYTSKDYDKAFNAYERLGQVLVGEDYELVRDFLHLRMALCLEKKAEFDKAGQMFKPVCESRSIALKALANYHSSLLESHFGQHLKARTRAYKTIALTGALASDCDWALDLERDCSFLAAEAITRQVLSLCDADNELPAQLWSSFPQTDYLKALDDTKLKAVLDLGFDRLNKGSLAPQIQSVELPGLTRWTVSCNGPGIDELMARFATNASLDIRWIRDSDQTSKNERSQGLSRSVVLYLQSATAQQVTVTAAGAAGLLAQLDDTNTIIITDPAMYSSLSQHSGMLYEHSIWLWRKLLLTYNDDPRTANAHFILGVLQGQKEQFSEAIAEYKLVANRYARSDLAPYALLRSSRLKTVLLDYAGASADLKQLIDQYPDNELIGQAHLDFAQTTMKAGHYDQAGTLYKKAFTLGSTTEARAAAALGAGKCSYQTGDYQSAIKWLTIYTEPETGAELNTAYLLLGKANLAMGNFEAACDALERTVKKASASDEYVEAVTSLVETHIRQENFVAALDAIENVRAIPFSQEQSTKLLVLKSKVLRSIGLTDKAVAELSDRTQYLSEPRLRADITLELARCSVAAKNLEQARAYFTEVISMVEPGQVSWQASLELADVCLKLDDHERTISICTQLKNSSADFAIKQQASKVLASAYSSQLEYDKAAVALMSVSVLPDATNKDTDKK